MMKAMKKDGEGKEGEGEGEGKEPEKVEDTCRTQKKNKMKKCYEEMCAKDAFMKSNKAACDKMAGRRRMEGETKMKCVGEIKMMDERCGKKENEDDCLKEGKSPFSDGICDWVEVEDKQEGGKFDQMINDAVKDLPEDQQKMVKMAAMECMKKFQEEAELKKRVGDDMEMIKECMMKAMKKDGEGKEGDGKEGEGEGKEPEKVEDTCRTQKKNKMKKCYEEMCAKKKKKKNFKKRGPKKKKKKKKK